MSLNASRIAGHRGLRAGAAQTLVLFMVPLVPGQADWAIGGELVVAGLGSSLTLLASGRSLHSLSDDDKRLISIFDRRDTNVIVASGTSDGLYLLLPATIVAFISGVLNSTFVVLGDHAAAAAQAPTTARISASVA